MIVKKRQLIAATLVAALGAALFVNWYFTKPETKSASGTVSTTVINSNAKTEGDGVALGDAQLVNSSSNDYFTEAKLKRDQAHDDALESLNDIIKDSSSNEDAVASARKMLEQLSSAIKLEADFENLITAKTSSKCLVIINENKIQVIVGKGVLNDTVSTQITDIILTQSDLFSENITLIEAK